MFHKMDNIKLRNCKDYLLLFNNITESCFSHCVNQLAERDLTQDESRCVDCCIRKFLNVNHKVIQVYMEIQPQIVNRRMEEMAQKAEAAAKESGTMGQTVINPKQLIGNGASG